MAEGDAVDSASRQKRLSISILLALSLRHGFSRNPEGFAVRFYMGHDLRHDAMVFSHFLTSRGVVMKFRICLLSVVYCLLSRLMVVKIATL